MGCNVATASERTAFDRLPVEGASQADLDDALVQATFTRALSLTPRALRSAGDYATKLKRLNFTDENGLVTKAGLLAAGIYPQQFYPRLVVDVAVHAGTEKGTPSAPRFLDRTICEGTTGEMIADAVAAVAKNLRRQSVVRGAGRIDELEIPEEVIREAVANALIHRDYSPCYDGQAVAVDIFDDRVEILNPGGLFGAKTQLNLADGSSRAWYLVCRKRPATGRFLLVSGLWLTILPKRKRGGPYGQDGQEEPLAAPYARAHRRGRNA